MAAQVQSESIYPVMPYLYMSGLFFASNGLSSNLYIYSGQCRDSQNLVDIYLSGDSFPAAGLEFNAVSPSLVLNGLVNGVNGLDTGPLASGVMYALYIIGDSGNKSPVASILSINQSVPLMPFGYDSYRLIGFCVTDGSRNFYTQTLSGNNGMRIVSYSSPKSVLTSGTSTTYAGVDISSFVPAYSQNNVNIQFVFNANAAADMFYIKPNNGLGNNVEYAKYAAPVAGSTALYYGTIGLPYQLLFGGQINYKVSTGLASLSLNVLGYTVFL